MNPSPQPPNVARFIGGVFGLVFAGIGLTVIGFVWSPSENSLHETPVFFKLFFSFIAVAFVAFGGAIAYGAIKGGLDSPQLPHKPTAGTPPPGGVGKTAGYQCPRCGAPLGEGADVSPSGDVKCKHCDTWFNIHHRA